MKKTLLFVVAFGFAWLSFTDASGNQWCCSWHWWIRGCSYWRIVCNDGTTSPSCTCSSSSSTTTYYKKSCFETYGLGAMDNYDWTCSCMIWYVWGKDSLGKTVCITEDQACKNQYWVSAKSLRNGKCGCNDWYIMKNWKCVEEMSEKWQECVAINNSEFNFLTKTCNCKEWYVFDWSNCITATESCQQQYGMYAIAWDPWYCKCMDWYEWWFDREYCIKSYTTTNTTWWTSTTYSSCDSYWPNSYLITSNKCWCKAWYEWNHSMNWCVVSRDSDLYGGRDFRVAKDWIDYINMLLDYEDELYRQNKDNDVQAAKTYLWDKTSVLDAIVTSVKQKNDNKLNGVLKSLVTSFKTSNDEYTKHIWVYLWSIIDF